MRIKPITKADRLRRLKARLIIKNRWIQNMNDFVIDEEGTIVLLHPGTVYVITSPIELKKNFRFANKIYWRGKGNEYKI